MEIEMRIDSCLGLITFSTNQKGISLDHAMEDPQWEKIECHFCGKGRQTAENCYVNPQSKYCKLLEKVKRALFANSKNESNKNTENHRVEFKCVAKFKTNKSVYKSSVSILNSGAAIKMLKEKSETKMGHRKKVLHTRFNWQLDQRKLIVLAKEQ